MTMNWQVIAERIEQATGRPFSVTESRPVGGGDINEAYRLRNDERTYFVKLNRPAAVDMFEAEAEGLREIAGTRTIRVPEPVVCGQTEQRSFLVLEYIEFAPSSSRSERQLGRQLALLHSVEQPYFGWHRDNTIGSTPQPNGRYDDWPGFWREQRLGSQLRLAAQNGYRGRLQSQGERLLADMDALFDDYRPRPSLLHGDLWGGNAAVATGGVPVIFDPACYYGDSEADLAMTELFGGFSRDFYAAYHEVLPQDPGYRVRKTFYNLYHILNHLNLFGSGYLSRAETMIGQLLAEI